MTNKSKTCNKCCPFWDKYGNRTCSLVEIGLFIPTHDHILQFCENEFFKCHNYNISKQQDQVFPPVENSNQPRSNRRLFTRFPNSLQMKLSRFSITKDTIENMLDKESELVDLSLGGMRIDTRTELNTNQIIFFSVDKQNHSSGFVGKGEVRWIRGVQSHDALRLNMAGLAFIDDDTRNTVKDYLIGLGEKILHKI